jgi:hypothetical protein
MLSTAKLWVIPKYQGQEVLKALGDNQEKGGLIFYFLGTTFGIRVYR